MAVWPYDQSMLRRALAILFALALLQAPVVSAAQAAERAPITILTVGDSITEGAVMTGSVSPAYRAELGRLLDAAGQPHSFVVAGVGGSPCGWWSSRMRDLMVTYRPDVVLIACGTNDHMDTKTPAQITAWEGMYRSLFDTVFDTSPTAIAYPALIQYSAGTANAACTAHGAITWLRGSEAKGNDAIFRAMKPIDEYGRRMPAYIDYQVIPEGFLDDCGVHPTPAGYDVMGRIAYNTIAPKLGLQPAPVPCGLTGRRDGYPVPARVPCT